ncbi:unnamed protein product, partial [Ectocarpus sp. 6 AP-2014]
RNPWPCCGRRLMPSRSGGQLRVYAKFNLTLDEEKDRLDPSHDKIQGTYRKKEELKYNSCLSVCVAFPAFCVTPAGPSKIFTERYACKNRCPAPRRKGLFLCEVTCGKERQNPHIIKSMNRTAHEAATVPLPP